MRRHHKLANREHLRGCIRLTHPEKAELENMIVVVELAYKGDVKFSLPSFGSFNEWRCYAYLPKQNSEVCSVDDA